MAFVPLTNLPDGSYGIIASLSAGAGARSRLYALGLTPGTKIHITSGGGGPCRLKVRDSELVLGHGLASKILVSKSD